MYVFINKKYIYFFVHTEKTKFNSIQFVTVCTGLIVIVNIWKFRRISLSVHLFNHTVWFTSL